RIAECGLALADDVMCAGAEMIDRLPLQLIGLDPFIDVDVAGADVLVQVPLLTPVVHFQHRRLQIRLSQRLTPQAGYARRAMERSSRPCGATHRRAQRRRRWTRRPLQEDFQRAFDKGPALPRLPAPTPARQAGGLSAG